MSDPVAATVAAPHEGTERAPEPRELFGLLVEFKHEDDLLAACRRVRDAGFSKWDAHSPYPVHGIDAAIGIRPTILPWIVFAGGFAGMLGGLLLQWWTNTVDYAWVVSGKPYFSLPANIPIIFEMTILFAAFGAVFGMLALNGLPKLYHAAFHSLRFRRVTDDRFFICIEAADPRFREAETRALLESLAGDAVERIEERGHTDPPKLIMHVGLVAACLALLPLALAARAWYSKSTLPRIHPILNMDQQEKFKAQRAHPLFADGRAMRPPVEGTVARADLHLLGEDDHYYYGKIDGEWATTLPQRLRADVPGLLERGRERFAIFCAPCHGMDGSGNGPVRLRSDELGMPLVVKAMHEDAVRERQLGHLFNTISNGINTMPPYGDQVPVRDRWAIVSYVRALQRSQLATTADLSEEQRAERQRRRSGND